MPVNEYFLVRELSGAGCTTHQRRRGVAAHDEFQDWTNTMTRTNELGQPIGDALPAGWQPPPAPSRPILQGMRVRVEPLDPERHIVDLFEANNLDQSGAGWTYLLAGPFADLAEYRNWMETSCMGDDPMFSAYIDLATGKAVGLGSYLRITPSAASIEVGHLRFSPKLQRTPLSTEAMYLMMKHAFDLGYRRYEWKCDALNAPSRAAAERYGFKFEGVFRQALHYRGRNRDTAWFSITDKEWP
ncbi:MAG: RimJ/RimL family protein N-acetyltransferase, partial [Hyphomicrobiaceae bacterium]